MASFDTPKAVGERVGRVAGVSGGTFTLDGAHDLAPGDGICFLTPRGVTGTNVNAVEGRRITPNRMEGITPGRRSAAISTAVSRWPWSAAARGG